MTEQAQKRYLEAIRLGNYREVAASYAGVSVATVHRFMKAKKGEEFCKAVLEAEKLVEIRIVGVIYKACIDGDLDAAKWYLSHKFPQRWGNNTELLRNVAKLLKSLEEERAQLRAAAGAKGGKGA